MAKTRVVFFCKECGHETPRWVGKCPGCGAWSSMVEGEAPTGKLTALPTRAEPITLDMIDASSAERTTTRIGEFDRVLGGGIVPGAVVLVGGDPGIGKSTLLLQVSDALSGSGETVMYVSGEESRSQLKLRAQRLGIDSPSIVVLTETDTSSILEQAGSLSPGVLIVDSIQTVHRPDVAGAPGCVSQVRESAAAVVRFAKQEAVPVFLIGHVTKQGSIAGPRILEHMVDTVLYFEGDKHLSYRILRAVKNRYGSTDEIGVFEMTDRGLAEVSDPSALFVSSRGRDASGSAVIGCVEGTRALMVELQALVGLTSYAVPQRSSTGVDRRRLPLILAVLERRCGLSLGNRDVFVSVAGGVRVEEPAADLGIAAAVASSYWDAPIDPHTALFGEIGLGGEVRQVGLAQRRAQEASRLGYRRLVLPKSTIGGGDVPHDVKLIEVEHVADALDVVLGRERGAGGRSERTRSRGAVARDGEDQSEECGSTDDPERSVTEGVAGRRKRSSSGGRL